MDSVYNPYVHETSTPQTKVLSVTGQEPIDELKATAYIRENTDLPAEDAQTIIDLITECRAALEKYLNISLIKKTIQVYYENFSYDTELPLGPHGAISNVTRIYEDSTEDAVEGTDYYVSGLEFKKLRLNRKLSTRTYGIPHGLQLEVVVGYDAADVPEDIRLGLKKCVATNYEYREHHGDSMSDLIPPSVKASLAHHRRNIWL